MTWAHKRQLIYFLIFFAVVLVIVGITTYFLLYQRPTCFDYKQNQGEFGVDCGGPCQKLCASQNLEPAVLWQQTFRVMDGIYSAVAYIQNPNISAESRSVPYTFRIYDNANALLAERKGSAFIPSGRTFAIFESNIGIPKGNNPVRTTFSFDNNIVWRVSSKYPAIAIENIRVSNATSTPSVEAEIVNPTLNNYGKVGAVVIVHDTAGNAVAASRTYADSVAKESKAKIVFTWPESFAGQFESCEKPTDVVLVIDKSGSMASDGMNPPEPMTSVKNAALTFLNLLKVNDRVGVVTFSTTAQVLDGDIGISNNLELAKESISKIEINKDGKQFTNIADALIKAQEVIKATKARGDSKTAIVLLTDGEANYPEKAGDKDFPSNEAKIQAESIKLDGVEIFTVGLGAKISADFLIAIATNPEHFYKAPSGTDLQTVYSSIATAMCKSGPARIEIIPEIILAQ